MIRSVEIENLRGIQSGKLDDLTPLTVLVGPNGCGKSTILEALLIGASQYPEKVIAYVASRRPGIQQGYDWLVGGNPVANSVNSKQAAIRVGTDANCQRSLRFSPSQRSINAYADFTGDVQEECSGNQTANTPIAITFRNGNFSQIEIWGRPLKGVGEIRLVEPGLRGGSQPLHTLFTQAVRQGRREQVNSLLRAIVPGLSHIEILTEADTPIVHLVHANGSVPAALAGDGIYTLVQQLLELSSQSDGVILLEEPETHKHPGAIVQSARAIWTAVRRGIQVVLTTHSIELIDILMSEITDGEELKQMSVYRLLLKDGCLRTSRWAGIDILDTREGIGMDLR